MSYVGEPFVHDLFISYSHGDDGTGTAYLQSWSAAFARELERELRTDLRFGKGLHVFLDQDHRPDGSIDPMAPLSDQIRHEIGASAIIVVLMSPDYLASKWCRDERDWWCARQTQLGLPHEERIAVVRIWPTESPWPAEFADSRGYPLVGFSFYGKVEGTDTDRPLGWTDLPGPFGSDFRKALIGIVGRLSPKLRALRARLEEQKHARAEAEKLAKAATGPERLAEDGDQLMIYLHGREDLEQSWECAANSLTREGFGVLPGEPDRVENDLRRLQEVRERRVETLTGCDALLLLGTRDGRALDADLVVVGKHDRQSARARSKRLLPCGLLDTIGVPVATPVRRATARILQADWLDGTRDPWTLEVRRWLAQKSTQAEQAA